MFRRWIVVAALFASVPASLAAAQPSSSVQQLNQQAMTAYVDLEIDRAQALLERALVVAARDGVRGAELARTHMNLGVLAIAGRGDSERGLTHFLDALEADPTITPDPATSTPDIAQVFRTARERSAASRATAAASSTSTGASQTNPYGATQSTESAAPLSPSAAAASTPVDSATAPTPADANVQAAPTSGRASRHHVHGLGLGYDQVFLARSGGGRYSVGGPAVVYDYYVGKRWGFMLRGAAWFPISARESQTNGQVVSDVRTDYPTQRLGFDALLMAARRMELGTKLVLTAGVGAHVQSFVLRGVVYNPVELISLGIGGLAKLEWLANGWLSLHVQATAAIDPYDAIRHDRRAVFTLPLNAAFGASIRF